MSKRIDLTGMQFNEWTVLEYMGYRRSYYKCKCSCGTVKKVTAHDIKSGHSKSCGHLYTKDKRTPRKAQKMEFHKCSNTKVHNTWKRIKQITSNPFHPKWKDYGGRGIKMCKRWQESFLAFLEDMGHPASEDLSIDRINNDGNYEPGNCRWTTSSVQNSNKRSWSKKAA